MKVSSSYVTPTNTAKDEGPNWRVAVGAGIVGCLLLVLVLYLFYRNSRNMNTTNVPSLKASDSSDIDVMARAAVETREITDTKAPRVTLYRIV